MFLLDDSIEIWNAPESLLHEKIIQFTDQDWRYWRDQDLSETQQQSHSTSVLIKPPQDLKQSLFVTNLEDKNPQDFVGSII